MSAVPSFVRCGAVALTICLSGCLSGCGRTPVLVIEGGDADSGQDGSGETGAQACAPSPEPPANDPVCTLMQPQGPLTQDAAGAIFARTVHESRHLLDRIDSGEAGPFEDVDDLGFMSATLGGNEAQGQCAAMRFACWTGGHGGFGPSALHGTATLTRTGTSTQIVGELGLVEGNALQGAPTAEVSITITAQDESGSVGVFEF